MLSLKGTILWEGEKPSGNVPLWPVSVPEATWGACVWTAALDQVENSIPRKRKLSGGTFLWGQVECVQEEVQAPACAFPYFGPQRCPPCAWDHSLGSLLKPAHPENYWEGFSDDTDGFGILTKSSSLTPISTPPKGIPAQWKPHKQWHQQFCITDIETHSQSTIQDRNQTSAHFRKETFSVPRLAAIVHGTWKLYLIPEFCLWDKWSGF